MTGGQKNKKPELDWLTKVIIIDPTDTTYKWDSGWYVGFNNFYISTYLDKPCWGSKNNPVWGGYGNGIYYQFNSSCSQDNYFYAFYCETEEVANKLVNVLNKIPIKDLEIEI